MGLYEVKEETTKPTMAIWNSDRKLVYAMSYHVLKA